MTSSVISACTPIGHRTESAWHAAAARSARFPSGEGAARYSRGMNTAEFGQWITQSADSWSARVQDPASIRLAAGSDLVRDPALPGGVEVSRLAWRALGTAGEHVGLLSHCVASSDGGVFAKPYLSLARVTMLGAARALYVLEPDTADGRRVRGLQLLRAEANDVSQVVADWEAATRGQDLSQAREAADQFKAECERELTSVGRKPGSVMSETALLGVVAPQLADGLSDPKSSLLQLWRLSSGTAHARIWAWDTPLEDDDPLTQYVAIWSMPMGMLERAWVLWNTRRGHEAAVR